MLNHKDHFAATGRQVRKGRRRRKTAATLYDAAPVELSLSSRGSSITVGGLAVQIRASTLEGLDGDGQVLADGIPESHPRPPRFLHRSPADTAWCSVHPPFSPAIVLPAPWIMPTGRRRPAPRLGPTISSTTSGSRMVGVLQEYQ
jgi:hypothetical protein